MQSYKSFKPTQFDSYIDIGRNNWLVMPTGRNRDSDCLDESNFHVALAELGGECEGIVEVHRFGHWANGWFEIILVAPDAEVAKTAHELERRLEQYPILDENDFSDREYQAAQETWKHCYSVSGRLNYVRKNRDQFEFHTFADMLSCVRGNYFPGIPSDILGC